MRSHLVALLVPLLLLQAGRDSAKETQAEYVTATADIHRTHRRFNEAISVYREALTIAPQYVPARRGLGNVYDLIGRHADARAEYKTGLLRANQFDDLALLRDLAASYVFERRFDEARGALQRAADLNVQRHGQSEGFLPLFFELAMAADAFDEADRVLERQFARLWNPAAKPRSHRADVEEALTLLESGTYHSLSAVVAARRGRLDEARRLLGEAETHLAKLDRLNATVAPPAAPGAPGPTAAIDSLLPAAEAAFWLGDTARPIRVFTKEAGNLPHYNLLLGQAYERERRLIEARAAYKRVVESTLPSIGLAWALPKAQARLAAIGR